MSKTIFKTFFKVLSKFVEQAKLLIDQDFGSCMKLRLSFVKKNLKIFVDNYGIPFLEMIGMTSYLYIKIKGGEISPG